MNLKKKKGSSLIFVLVTFAVIIIFGFSVLSLTLMSYKKRFVEANEKRNQYFSESGIDIAYGIIGKTVDRAVEEGNNAVNAELENINKAAKSELSEEDNEKYKKYLKADGTLNKEEIDKAMSELFWGKYKKHIEEKLVGNIADKSLYDVGEGKNGKPHDKPIVTVTDKDGKSLMGENPKEVKLSFVDDGDKEDNALSVHLQSEFSSNKTSDEAANSGQIHKKISVTYIIGPSKYEKPITQKVENVKIPMTEVWKKAICTDGNLLVNANLNVTGDVYVKGTDNGGIKGIEINSGSSKVNGIIATSGNFNLNASDNINFTVNGNVYAENLSLSSKGSNINSPGKPLNLTVLGGSKPEGELLGAIYTNNDLEVLGSNVAINTKYFYGINDITEENPDGSSKPQSSSSILMNPDESGNKSSVSISDKALFMGVAYIQTSPQYQTGESVSIKGNYKAYTQSLKEGEDKFKEGNVIFKYYSPLVLASAFKDASGNEKDMNVNDKSKYIQQYIEEYKSDFEKWKEKVSISLPGNIDNILSIGTYIDNHKVAGSNYKHEDFLRVKKAKYSRVVYSMNSEGDNSEDDDFNKIYGYYEDDKGELIDELKEKSQGFDNYVSNNLTIRDDSKNKTVSNQIPFDKIKKTINETVTHKSSDSYNGKKDIIYLNGNENDKVYVIGDGGYAPTGVDSIDTRIVQGGIIITKGEVHLSGNVNFTGTIISAKDITCENSSNPTITYNQEYIRKIIGTNGDYFSGIVIQDSTNQDSVEYISVTDYGSQQNNVGTDSIRNAELIKMKNWRILQ